jgi:3-(3-hydroxy-phenyl)propionate hydroxylase
VALKRILIAGAGPVGLTAAYALSRAGIETAVFERGPTLAEDLRASTWHPPTLDMLEELGLVGEILRDGLVARYMQHRDRRTGAIAEFDHELLRGETNHPYRVQYEQFRYTRMVHRRLDAEVRLDAGVASVSQDGGKVKVTLEDGSEHAGDYLIVADGASSAVRRSIGVEF